MQADNRRDISVIIQVYGVERFVEACVRSLMEQTLREGVEFIFVDDATPDASIDTVRRTVADYPDRAAQVKILTHSRNRGLPSARNTGLEAACGEYVVHIDSDDFAEPQMLEAMLDEARRSGADMVWCDWYLSTDNGERRMPTPDISDAREAMMAMLGGTMKFNVWNKLTRRSIFTGNALRFPDGYPMGEDMTMIRACARCRMTAHVGRPLYHYRRTNSGAMTQAYSDAHFSQLRHNADLTAGDLAALGAITAEETDFFRLQVKFPFLLMDPASRGFRLWREWWPEANRRAAANPYGSRHSRMAQRWAARGWWWPVRLYRMLLKFYQSHA